MCILQGVKKVGSIVMVFASFLGCADGPSPSPSPRGSSSVAEMPTDPKSNQFNIQHSTFTILLAGDLLLDRGIRTIIEREGVSYLFDSLRPIINSVDVFIPNFESAATEFNTPEVKQFVFNTPVDWLDSLRSNSVTHVTLANNHSVDYGRGGLVSTAENLEKAGITPIGYGSTHSKSCDPVLIEKGDDKIAVFSAVFLPLENWLPFNDKPCICQMNAKDLAQKIKEQADQDPRVPILILLHWGAEYHTEPMVGQIEQAKMLIEAGADLIVGHHPHVVQTYSEIDGVPVYFSLGNFIFDQSRPRTDEGLMIRLLVEKSTIHVQEIPYRIHEGQVRPSIQGDR